MSLRNEALVAVGIGLVAALIPFHRALGFPFALDDYTFLFKAAGIDPSPFQVRRWLTVTGYYELGLALFGTKNLLSWHLVSFVVHAGNTVWVHVLARRFGASRNAAWIASGLFASSPLAFTVLYWVAGIQEIASTLFLLASVWFAMRAGRGRWISVPLFTAAVLCKESVMAAPLALPLLLGRRSLRIAIAQLAIGIGLFLASGLHQRLDSDVSLPYATSFGTPFFVNLATLTVWFASPWRTYPDRVAGPQSSLVVPAVMILGAIVAVQLVTRRRTQRPMLMAGAWFVALLLPVLPLYQHTYAYYLYAAQIGWLVLTGIAIERAAQRFGRRVEPAVLAAGAAVVALSIFFAARNASTHENMTLESSTVPWDSVVRYGRAAEALAAAARNAKAQQPDLQQIAFFSLNPPGPGPLTPGKFEPGMVRVRKIPIREALRDGKLVSLHVPGLTGVWVDSLSTSVEGPETAIFFAFGFNDLTRMSNLSEAYCAQAQGNLMFGTRSAAERDLERALSFAPDHALSRLLLAGLRIENGQVAEARALVTGLRAEDLPAEIQPLLVEIQKVLEE